MNLAPKSVLLIGPPGSGKSTMACLTAVHKPVHALDIDRKLRAMANLASAFESKQLTSWELEETISEGSLADRVKNISTNTKPTREPRGWNQFAKFVERLPSDEVSKRAGTWYVGSATLLSYHLVQSILFNDPKANVVFSPREWQYFLYVWQETITILIDTAKANGKDLIIDVHERPGEVPTAGAKVMYSGSGANRTREIIGTLDLKVWASIGGQFGGLIGAFFEEVYGLSVEIDGSHKPKWVCRLDPDGKRDLRCSFAHSTSEVEPDFRKIWNMKEVNVNEISTNPTS